MIWSLKIKQYSIVSYCYYFSSCLLTLHVGYSIDCFCWRTCNINYRTHICILDSQKCIFHLISFAIFIGNELEEFDLHYRWTKKVATKQTRLLYFIPFQFDNYLHHYRIGRPERCLTRRKLNDDSLQNWTLVLLWWLR